MENLRLLLVHAHPDDETINNGATMALYVERGAKVTLVTCTRGEEGEVLVPELEHLASNKEDRLGKHREGELADAMAVLGVTDFRFLGAPHKIYRDSGMMDTEANKRSDNFWNANLDEAASHLVEIILEVKPQVMVTYDEIGGYGHPDHIQAHRVAMRAAEIARAQGWEIKKIYWNTIPKSVIEQGIEAMKGTGNQFFGVDKAEDFPFAQPDELVTTVIDAESYAQRKMQAMKAHPTQISVDGPFFALSDNLGFKVWGQEFYRLVYGEKGNVLNQDGRETDLFSGISTTVN
ncbi:MAG: N-acetyl-1-D-myo-inositol-2-amino-2-deoxy-alpha-D-glucopyranoside deacetylase [Candidatus Nanopelagicaceae bacterium]|nr:N-acetyl-1-D-myo-inositol-2-amino-2-deoxy-alpha-D-glucopyranoside deacetylase [Candidatus Nanopelagicaceae bacterium]